MTRWIPSILALVFVALFAGGCEAALRPPAGQASEHSPSGFLPEAGGAATNPVATPNNPVSAAKAQVAKLESLLGEARAEVKAREAEAAEKEKAVAFAWLTFIGIIGLLLSAGGVVLAVVSPIATRWCLSISVSGICLVGLAGALRMAWNYLPWLAAGGLVASAIAVFFVVRKHRAVAQTAVQEWTRYAANVPEAVRGVLDDESVKQQTPAVRLAIDKLIAKLSGK